MFSTHGIPIWLDDIMDYHITLIVLHRPVKGKHFEVKITYFWKLL